MTPLARAQRASLKRYLVFLEEELSDLPRFRSITYAVYSTDRDTRRNLERLCENLVNASIDIGKILLAGEAQQVPGSYRQVFRDLSHLGIIGEETSQRLQVFTRLRNLLAHEYLEIRWDQLRAILEHGEPTFASLVQATRSLLIIADDEGFRS